MEDLHLLTVEHAQHTTKPLRRRTLTRVPTPTFMAGGIALVTEEELSVTHLHRIMLEELRYYAEFTMDASIRTVEHFC